MQSKYIFNAKLKLRQVEVIRVLKMRPTLFVQKVNSSDCILITKKIKTLLESISMIGQMIQRKIRKAPLKIQMRDLVQQILDHKRMILKHRPVCPME